MAKVRHESSFSWNNYVAFLNDVPPHRGTMNVSRKILLRTFGRGGCNAIRCLLIWGFIWSGSPPFLWSEPSKLGNLTRFDLAIPMAGANKWMSWLLCCYANGSQLGVIWFTALRLCLWSYRSPLITTQRLNSHTVTGSSNGNGNGNGNSNSNGNVNGNGNGNGKHGFNQKENCHHCYAMKLHPQAMYWHSNWVAQCLWYGASNNSLWHSTLFALLCYKKKLNCDTHLVRTCMQSLEVGMRALHLHCK